MRVICGDMEFGHFIPSGGADRSPVTIVHKIDAVMHVDDGFDVDSLLDRHDSYIVCNERQEILYAPGAFDFQRS